MGVIGALSSLLQLQRIYQKGSANDVSVRFLPLYAGGYLVWLIYGIIYQDIALIIVDLVGIVVASSTVLTALTLRVREGG